MTVSSLWTVLDEAGCGTPVGIDDFSLRGRGDQPDQQTILAVDLSIWVCEGITSTALTAFHSDPALHLVYQRTTKLLKLGVGLVFVVEGQRRVCSQISSSSSSQTHEFKQRRSGSQFWNASKRCEAMLKLLGIPVVRAEAEGEALCALLNGKGLVDGVISNDGDCLLFGAKTVYTSFSAENLEARKVVRYDSDKLVANLDNSYRTIKLSREDLVVFAILGGSDMCGDGVPNVGHKKVIQFLHACRSLKHQCDERTCLDEVMSWNDFVVDSTKTKEVCVDCDDGSPITIQPRCCSLCLHPGDKRQHEKYGCAECGTGPGEGCYVVTSSEKLLRSLRDKALGSLAHRRIVNGYFSPNSNDVPSKLNSLKSKPYDVSIDAPGLFATSMMLKGRTKESSQDYIRQTLPKLLVRLDLWHTGPRNRYVTSKQSYKAIPTRIENRMVKLAWPCYEITWSINFHPTSEEALAFVTFECQSLVNSNYPQLVKVFQQEERRRQQGRAEDERLKRFTGTSNYGRHRNQSERQDLSKKLQQQGCRRKRRGPERKFEGQNKKARTQEAQNTSSTGEGTGGKSDHYGCNQGLKLYEDIDREKQLDGLVDGKFVRGTRKASEIDDITIYADTKDDTLECEDLRYSPQCDVAGHCDECNLELKTTCEHILQDDHLDDNFGGDSSRDGLRELTGTSDGIGPNQRNAQGDVAVESGNSLRYHLSPNRERFFCDMGIQIEVTPIISRRWQFF